MKQVLRVPKVAVSMQSGILTTWFVEDGAHVKEGQPLYTLEIEKSVMDIEAPVSGVFKRIGVLDQTYKIGEIIGEIESG